LIELETAYLFPNPDTFQNADDLAFVEIVGVRHYLGEFDSPESKHAYHRKMAEWIESARAAWIETSHQLSAAGLYSSGLSKPAIHATAAWQVETVGGTRMMYWRPVEGQMKLTQRKSSSPFIST
jgi:hypothetical protein